MAFFAAGFPACVERIVVPDMFIVEMPSGAEIPGRSGVICHLARCDALRPQGDWWKRIIGWNPYSGYEPEDRDRHALQAYLGDLVRKVDWSSARELGVDPRVGDPRDRDVSQLSTPSAGARATRKKRGVLFGYGHYAKTNILPNIRRHIEVAAIHEVDPTQTPEVSRRELRWDTAPVPRDDADYDVYLIAGYHHTHAPLAVAALERGAYAVSEKPIAVDEEQLDALLAAMEKAKGGYFGCFHKRYTQMNDYAIQGPSATRRGANRLPLHRLRGSTSRSALVSMAQFQEPSRLQRLPLDRSFSLSERIRRGAVDGTRPESVGHDQLCRHPGKWRLLYDGAHR